MSALWVAVWVFGVGALMLTAGYFIGRADGRDEACAECDELLEVRP